MQWQWRAPLWLWALLYPLLPAVLGWLRPGRTARLIDRALRPWMILPASELGWRRIPVASLLWWLGWSCLVISLAGPRLPDSNYTSGQAALRDVMVVVDVSRSMTATDVAPSRLRRARLELESLLPQLHQSRLGLVVYAARPHLVAPLTDDISAFGHYLTAIADDILPTEGSDPFAALALALQQLPEGEHRPAALLLLSDGGYDREGFAAAWTGLKARLLARAVKLYVLGIGTPQGGPLLGAEGGWLNLDGTPVVVRLQESRLQEMADDSGGGYVRVADDDSDWSHLYNEGIARLGLASADTHGEAQAVWQSYHRPFLITGLVLIFLALIRPFRGRGHIAPLAVWLVLGLFAIQPEALRAEGLAGLSQADVAYAQQNYEQALGGYARLSGYRARMGEASSAYRLQRYARAMRQYTLALLAANSDPQRADALYDLGNCRFQLGDFAAAEGLYRDVLRYVPGHPQAGTNLAIASSLRKAVEERLVEERAGRPGRGSRSGRAAEGLTPGDSQLSLDKEDKTQPYAIQGADTDRQALIERGVRYSTVASSAPGKKADDSQWQYTITDLTGLGGLGPQTGDDPSRLWRRLFETEEGYPAPQERPHELPGRSPW